MTSDQPLDHEAATLLAIHEEMRRDSSVFYMATNPQPSLIREFGGERALVTPISEECLTGIAIGSAASGLRPVLSWKAFGFTAFDQVANQAAKLRYMSGGQFKFPIVFTAWYGADHNLAAQHCQSIYAVFAHIPGLKVVVPSTPSDSKALMKAAIRDDNPVCFFEPPPGRISLEDLVGGEEDVAELGIATTRRAGKDVTVVALGHAVDQALEVAQAVERDGISVEVIDPRTLVPLDVETLRDSVRRTGHLVVADEAQPFCSVAAEICALITEDPETFASLRGPVQRACSRPVPIPYSPPLEDYVLLSPRRIEEAIRVALGGR